MHDDKLDTILLLIRRMETTTNGLQQRYSRIFALVEHPDFPLKDFARVILMQMCIACRELSEVALHPSTAFRVGPLVAHIRALRDLAETARLVAEFTVQENVVNLDGPKFALVYDRIMQALHKSVLEAGCTPHLWNTICRFAADNLGKADLEIRRDIKRAHKLAQPENLPWSQTKSVSTSCKPDDSGESAKCFLPNEPEGC